MHRQPERPHGPHEGRSGERRRGLTRRDLLTLGAGALVGAGAVGTGVVVADAVRGGGGGGAGRGPLLKHRPPKTTVDVHVPASGGTVTLPPGEVARLIWPKEPITDVRGGVTIDGGEASAGFHSVGGEVSFTRWLYDAQKKQSEYRNRPLYITGFPDDAQLYLEGFFGHGKVTDGIDVGIYHGKGVQITFANVLIGTRGQAPSGTRGTNHSDGSQFWAGGKSIRIDGCTYYVGYQGLNFSPGQHNEADDEHTVELRNVQLCGEDGAAFLIWTNKDRLTVTDVDNCWYTTTEKRSVHQRFRDAKGEQPGAYSPFQKGLDEHVLRTPGSSGVNYRSPGYV
jgi:hypothetical protein